MSAGSACHGDSTTISYVLEAMGVPEDFAVGTLRISCGRHTTLREVERAAACIVKAVRWWRAAGAEEKQAFCIIDAVRGVVGLEPTRTARHSRKEE